MSICSWFLGARKFAMQLFLLKGPFSHSSSGKPTHVLHSWRPSLFLYPNLFSSYSYTESNKAPYLQLHDIGDKGISSLFFILPTEATDFPHRWLCTCAQTKFLSLLKIKYHEPANLRETQMRVYANLQRRTTETVRGIDIKYRLIFYTVK